MPSEIYFEIFKQLNNWRFFKELVTGIWKVINITVITNTAITILSTDCMATRDHIRVIVNSYNENWILNVDQSVPVMIKLTVRYL